MIGNINRRERWKFKAIFWGAVVAFAAVGLLALYGAAQLVFEDVTERDLRVTNAELAKQYTMLLVENNEMRRYCRWAALLEPRLSPEAQDTLDSVNEMIRQWKVAED